MPIASSDPRFDALFLFYNRLWGHLDGALKKAKRGPLTLTSLQVLVQMAADQDARCDSTRARLARTLGLSPGTIASTVRSLRARALVEEAPTMDERARPIRLTKLGRAVAHGGQVERDDAIEEFIAPLTKADADLLFQAIAAVNQKLNAAMARETQRAYLKTVRKHSTRKHIRKYGVDESL